MYAQPSRRQHAQQAYRTGRKWDGSLLGQKADTSMEVKLDTVFVKEAEDRWEHVL